MLKKNSNKCVIGDFHGNIPDKKVSASDVAEPELQLRSVSGHVLILAMQRTTTKRKKTLFLIYFQNIYKIYHHWNGEDREPLSHGKYCDLIPIPYNPQ